MEKEQEKIGIINFDEGFKKPQRIFPSCTLYEDGVPNRKNWLEEQAKRIQAVREDQVNQEKANQENSPAAE